MIKLRHFVILLILLSFWTIHAKTTVKSASELDYPPLAVVNNGKADGFSVDLLKAALKSMNTDVSFYVGPWSEIKNDLTQGKIDVLPLVGRTVEREAVYDFTVPYLTLYGALFVREGNRDIKTPTDLLRKSVVVMKGDNAEEFVRRTKLSDKIHTVKTFEEAFLLLSIGKYDAVITQKKMGTELLKKMGISNVIPIIELFDFKQDFTFAVKEGNSKLLNKLNEGLSRVITNGTYKKIYDKWFKHERTKHTISKKESKIENFFRNNITVIIFAVLFIVLLTILTLRWFNVIKFEQNIILLLLMVTLALIIGLFLINAYNTTANLKRNAVKENFNTLNAAAFTINTNIRNEIEHNLYLIYTISLRKEISNSDLFEITRVNPDILSIFTLDSSGEILHSSELQTKGLNISEHSIYKDLRDKNFNIPIHFSEHLGKVVSTLSTPFGDGLLVAYISVDHIKKIVTNIEGLGVSGESLLAYRNKNGDAVFFTNRKFHTEIKSRDIIPKKDINVPITQALLGNQNQFSDYVDYRGVPVFAVTKYIEKIDAGIVVKIDRAEALKSVSQSIETFWLSTLGTITTIIIIFTIFYLLLTRALRNEITKKTTEYKNAEKEKRKLEEKLQQSQKMEAVGTLAGGIAHDFNNILSPIIGYTELLLSEVQNDSSSEKRLTTILNAASRAKNLVQQILAFSRQNKTQKKPIELQPIIKEVLTLMKSVLPSTISIEENIDMKCRFVLADHTQMHQILMNLCTNAFQSMEKAGGSLKIELKEVDSLPKEIPTENKASTTNYALLTVSDNGKGISKNDLKRIFEPYFTTKGKEKGTGLGLSVVHGIVKDAGGEITVSSEINKGSTFKIYLPIISFSAENASTSQIRIGLSAKKRIMLVDDEDVVLEVECEILEESGYLVSKFRNSLEAFNRFKSDPNHFDIILTDKTMPGMTGLQLAEDVKKIRNDIPVILCTGFIDFDLKKEAEEKGISAIIQKPVPMKILLKTVRDTLLDS